MEQVTLTFGFSNKIVERMANDLVEGKAAEDIAENQFGYEGLFGLTLAQAKLQIFNEKEKRIPTNKDEKMAKIDYAVQRGYWTTYGIKTWNDLLKLTLDSINLKKGEYHGQKGLEQVMEELKELYKKDKKLPRSSDKRVNHIRYAVDYGYWKEYGIITWSDLLYTTFKELNQTKRHSKGYYRGEEGLKRIMNELKEFYEREGRIPKLSDPGMRRIAAIAQRGQWSIYQINTWNDLLKTIFGKNNHRQKIYKGEKGLDYAIKEMKVFYEKNRKMPTYNDKEMGGITSAIGRGEWKLNNILTWNDLLEFTFSAVVQSYNIYKGKEGLQKAVEKIKKFYEVEKRLPLEKDKGMGGIRDAIYRGEWILYGIKSWKMLKKYAISEL